MTCKCTFVQVKPTGNGVVIAPFITRKTLRIISTKLLISPNTHKLNKDQEIGSDPWVIKGQIPLDSLIIIFDIWFFILFLPYPGISSVHTRVTIFFIFWKFYQNWFNSFQQPANI